MSTIRTSWGGGNGANDKIGLADYYRGGVYPAGLVGVYSASAFVASLIRGKWVGQRISDSGGVPSEISLNFASTSGLTQITGGWNGGGQDDGYWNIPLPWTIYFLGVPYTTVHPATNGYITFGAGSTAYSGLSASNPALPKICWGGADNSAQQIYHGVQGTSPNRSYRIRIEGNNSTSGSTNLPTMLVEIIFYENATSQIDLHIWQNSKADLQNIATPRGALVNSNTAPAAIPTGQAQTPETTTSSTNAGKIAMGDFVNSKVLTAYTAGYFTLASVYNVTITTGSGKFAQTNSYAYGGWREAGFDIAGNPAGNNTAAFGTPSVQSTMTTANGSYFPRAWYWYQNNASSTGSQVLILSSSVAYPIVNDGTIPSWNFPVRNPSNQSLIIDSLVSAPYGIDNFMVGSLYCTRMSKQGPIQSMNAYYPPNGTARNMVINAYV